MNMGEGRGPLMVSLERAKDFKGAVLKLTRYLGSYRWMIIFVWVLTIVSTVFIILGPKMLGQATDDLFKGIISKIAGTGNVDFDKIGRIILWLTALYIVSAVFSYLQGYFMAGVTAKVTYKMRNDILDKINVLPFGYFDGTTYGDILSRITNDVDIISQTLNQSLTQIITSLATIAGIAVMMFTISWQLALAALLIIPVSLVFVAYIVKKSQKYFGDQQKYLGIVDGHIEEMFGNQIVVKAFCGEEDSEKTFDGYNESLYKSAWKSNFLSGLMMPLVNFLSNLAYVVISIIGGYLVVSGAMTVGGIQAFILYARTYTQPISQIANISSVLQQTAAAAERVFEFLEEKEEVKEADDALTVNRADRKPDTGTHIHVKGNVGFDHVSFGYTGGKMIIHDFSADVKAGQKIAIVGPTGAGKTTMVKLLMRFYDVSGGAIMVDGHDIRLFKRGELRSVFGMVLQDSWLFNGTIADNIKYGKFDASDEEVRMASEAAQVDHFVRTLPDGYNTVINEEASNISLGQKQLLTIARAILADPEILILDEATSSVDTLTEVLIQKAMDNLMKDRTSFIIAHRLSTIRNADLILVMRDGDIVEQGTHEDLLERNGFYAEMYNSQFEKAV
jgi:ATP-binding cassette subfamily B multidrug efflux pump